MNSVELIESYYHAFNQNDMKTFFSLLSDDVVHDINQGGRQVGKEAFKQFMAHMEQCYQEKISDVVVMINTDGSRAAAEFMVDGIYLVTDKGFPEAKNQHYRLSAGAFFEIQNDKITRVTTFYNVNKWLKMVTQ